MKHLLLLSFLFSGYLFAQEHNHNLCAQAKIKQFNAIQKSNSRDLSEMDNYNIHYAKLDIEVDNLSTNVNGSAILKATVEASFLTTFVFELDDVLSISSVLVNGVLNTNVTRIGSEVRVDLASAISQGNDIEVEIFYGGLGQSGPQTGIFNASSPSWGNQVTYTLSQPFGAYTWWPCKQVLTDKIDSMDIHITTPSTLKAGSNGILVNEVALPSNKTRYEWKSTYPIDFYLVSFAVSEYIDYSFKVKPFNSPDSILVQNFIYSTTTLNAFKNDIDETADMLLLFADQFGPYPFQNEKYGHSMAPISGGMEHQTMTSQGFFARWLTAHELGHQWFGDNVTCATWHDIFVNEGFASYTQYLFEESIDVMSADADFLGVHNFVMSEPGGSVFVPDITNANRIFSSRLTYDKGAALIHMIRYWMGDEDFFEALKTYQNQYQYNTATTEDLFDVLEAQSGLDFTNFKDHWYYGEGFPTISAEWNQTASDFVLQLDQVGSMPAITPFFETYLDVKLFLNNGTETTIKVFNTLNGQHYLREVTEIVDSIEIDSKNWVLNQIGTINKNTSLEYDSTISSIEKIVRLDVNVFPNPASNDFSISVEKNNDLLTIIIIDLQGRVVFENEFKNSIQISTNQFASGVYWIKVGNQTERLIVTKE